MLSAQRPGLELSFSAIDSLAYVQHDSIKVINRSQESDTTLYWPDTVLYLNYPVGISSFQNMEAEFILNQNYPNPAIDKTFISFYLPEKDKVRIRILDIQGRVIETSEKSHERGHHQYIFRPGSNGVYFFNATYRNQTKSIKIINLTNRNDSHYFLRYNGINGDQAVRKDHSDSRSFYYAPGDTLLLVACYDTLESGMLDSPAGDSTYIFQFAYNIPCIGLPWISYAGNTYHTVQIFNQCWLNRNLSVGSVISGSLEMKDNDTIEQYCYDDNVENCYAYGGLYQWDEMMNYNPQEGNQGICPDGWHIPTDEEIKLLSGAVDSEYGIGDTVWDIGFNYRGFDAGYNLRSDDGWYGGYNGCDIYGFATLPCGRRIWDGQYNTLTTVSWIWSSTTHNTHYGWYKEAHYMMDNLGRYYTSKRDGLGVRCLKD
jgi:uncharacterized protein (TIGR02145 family)